MHCVLHRYRFSSVGTEGVTPPGPTGVPPSGTGGLVEQARPEQSTSTTDPAAALQAKLDKATEHMRTWEARAKENAAAATKLAEIEEAQKSTEERLTGKVGKLESELTTARSEVARLTAAIEHGLSTEDLVLLPKGLSDDEVSTAAKRLAERGSAGAGGQQGPPSFDGGQRSTARDSDWNDQVRDALRNRRR